jgi:hypothetical protein
MSDIIAKNASGITRTFKELQWSLLGKDKGGWVQMESQQVVSSLVTGEKQKQKDALNPIAEPSNNSEQLDAFIKASIGISKSDLQAFCSKNEIKFEPTDKVKDLVYILGNKYDYDINFFKNNF